MNNLIKENVINLKAYKVSKDSFEIKLDANENPYNLFNKLKDEFIRELENINLNRYPDTDCFELRKLLSGYTGAQENSIICGNGSDEIIQIIIYTFADKGENIIIHTPTFPMYGITSSISGVKTIEIPSDESFNADIDGIIKEANRAKAKIIFLCNPNNPTGNKICRKDIIRVIEETQGIVVVDEAYYEFCGETVIDMIENYNRLIVVRTLSKAFGIAGARIGYAVAGKEIMDALYKVKPPYNLNTLSQTAGIVMMKNIKEVKKTIEAILDEKKRVIHELGNIKGIKVYQGCGNFILIKTDNKKYAGALQNRGIAVKAYGTEGRLGGCIRITIGAKEENNEVINALKRVVL